MWVVYALLGAIFASLNAICAKVGLVGVNSYLATGIRSVVILGLSWSIVLGIGGEKGLPDLSKNNWWFLILSGLSSGFSWICFYKALKMGDASKVVSVDKLSVVLTIIFATAFLGEPISRKTVVGAAIMTIGITLLI
ncbi:MAG: EamA family transporter [Deltaproteobacteria bacterium]|nr:EamA family transporter [Deltaproteobacteria bacterium]